MKFRVSEPESEPNGQNCTPGAQPSDEEIKEDVASKPRNTRLEKLSYRLDWWLSKRWVQGAVLCSLGLLEVSIGGLVYAGVWTWTEDECDPREEHEVNRISEGLWEAWNFMTDPGTHAKASSTQQRIVAALISMGGILFFACVIAIVVDVTREKMEKLRQGKSPIVETRHTVVLGWTDKTILVLMELCFAMESEGGGMIVVLANEDKELMEVELGLQLPKSKRFGTQVAVRSGSPLLITELGKVGCDTAKAIIILAGAGDPDRSDADTLRCMLSLRSMSYPLQGFVIAEVRDIDNEPLVKLVGGACVETLVSHDVLGRLMLMSAREPGLARVYEALLGFQGHEFYLQEWPELVGLRFGDLMERFADAVPVGLRRSDGGVLLNPPWDQAIQQGDLVIVVAEDDDTYRPMPPALVETGEPPPEDEEDHVKEKILFCGWRRDIRDILLYLDNLVTEGTEVHMMTHSVPVDQRNDRLLEEGLDVRDLKRLELVHHSGNTSVRQKMKQLPLAEFNSCMIFADQAFEADAMHADSHSLATLLLIRDMQQRSSGVVHDTTTSMPGLARSLTSIATEQMKTCPIVCEVLDPRTQRTITGNRHVSLASDFCQTNKLIAQIMAMVAEERSVKLLLDELLGADGCNLNVMPARRYVGCGEEVSFYTIGKRALLFGELAIGYQATHSTSAAQLNPTDKAKLCAWDGYDIAILRGVGIANGLSSTDSAAEVDATLGVFNNLAERRAVEGAAAADSGASLENATANPVVDRGAVLPGLPSFDGSGLGGFRATCDAMSLEERRKITQALDVLRHIVANPKDFAENTGENYVAC